MLKVLFELSFVNINLLTIRISVRQNQFFTFEGHDSDGSLKRLWNVTFPASVWSVCFAWLFVFLFFRCDFFAAYIIGKLMIECFLPLKNVSSVTEINAWSLYRVGSHQWDARSLSGYRKVYTFNRLLFAMFFIWYCFHHTSSWFVSRFLHKNLDKYVDTKEYGFANEVSMILDLITEAELFFICFIFLNRSWPLKLFAKKMFL